jgi:hypothetical protein
VARFGSRVAYLLNEAALLARLRVSPSVEVAVAESSREVSPPFLDKDTQARPAESGRLPISRCSFDETTKMSLLQTSFWSRSLARNTDSWRRPTVSPILTAASPMLWRDVVEVQDAGKPADVTGYR